MNFKFKSQLIVNKIVVFKLFSLNSWKIKDLVLHESNRKMRLYSNQPMIKLQTHFMATTVWEYFTK